MMNVSTLTVLLVCVILERAHSASFERGWERLSPRSKRSTLNKFSVVDDWDSVCQAVCRVGYGGPGCGVGCNAQVSLGHNDLSLKESFGGICSKLCENGLGLTKCECPLSSFNPDLKAARNSFCTATCSWTSSFIGCTKCRTKPVGTTDDSETTVYDTTDDYGTTNTTDEEASTSEEYSTDEQEKTTDENSTDEQETTDPNEDDSTTEEDTTTTSTTTTTTQPTTTTTKSTTQATTTTPNWESMCEALCRNGEGGSLCNCDIPPFF